MFYCLHLRPEEILFFPPSKILELSDGVTQFHFLNYWKVGLIIAFVRAGHFI